MFSFTSRKLERAIFALFVFWAFCFFLVLQTWRPGTGQGSGLLFRWHHTVGDNTLALHQTARRFLHYSLIQCSLSDYWLNWLMQLDQLITCDNRWWYYQSQYLVGRLGEACHKQVVKWKVCANGIVFFFFVFQLLGTLILVMTSHNICWACNWS